METKSHNIHLLNDWCSKEMRGCLVRAVLRRLAPPESLRTIDISSYISLYKSTSPYNAGYCVCLPSSVIELEFFLQFERSPKPNEQIRTD